MRKCTRQPMFQPITVQFCLGTFAQVTHFFSFFIVLSSTKLMPFLFSFFLGAFTLIIFYKKLETHICSIVKRHSRQHNQRLYVILSECFFNYCYWKCEKRNIVSTSKFSEKNYFVDSEFFFFFPHFYVLCAIISASSVFCLPQKVTSHLDNYILHFELAECVL